MRNMIVLSALLASACAQPEPPLAAVPRENRFTMTGQERTDFVASCVTPSSGIGRDRAVCDCAANQIETYFTKSDWIDLADASEPNAATGAAYARVAPKARRIMNICTIKTRL